MSDQEMPQRRDLQSLSEFPSPPPPLLTPFKTQTTPSSPNALNSSILIISLILTLVFFVSVCLHFLLRYIDRRRHPYSLPTTSPPSPPNTHQPLVEHHRRVSSSDPQQALIDSLPAFSFDSVVASAPAAFQKSSAPDCAVCLSRFEPGDQLRFLPACCHAFHSRCIDTWLASNRTCPLCRSTISVHIPIDSSAKTSVSGESFRVEIGSVSRRRTSDSGAGSRRSYSMGSFDYVIDDDDVIFVAAGPAGHSRGVSYGGAKDKEGEGDGEQEGAAMPAPGVAEVAEAAGGRGWLKEYVDRLASSASSSFSSSRALSFRLRGSTGGVAGTSRRSNGGSWDVDGSKIEEDGSSFFRWLTGA